MTAVELDRRVDGYRRLARQWSDHPVDIRVRALLIPAGFLPVTLIAASTFNVIGLRALAICVLAPVVLMVACLIARHPDRSALVSTAMVAGIVATGPYDLFRFTFIWSGLMGHDPIPHIGTALGLRPAWVFGYLWRYLGNGGGLAVAFTALGLKGVRRGVLFGLCVCSGLLALLVACPNARVVLFPLTGATIVMAIVGHAIYGAILGALSGPIGAGRWRPALGELSRSVTPDQARATGVG